MKALALGIFEDMRRRRLLPIALLLIVAIVAVPLVLRQPAEEPTPVASTATASQQTPAGLPSPEQALNGNDKPLVTLAVLEQASHLEEFESKNPFKPLEQTSKQGSSTPASDAPTNSPTAGGTGGGSGSTGGSGGTTTTPQTTTTPTETTPKTTEPKGTTKKDLTYALDVSLTGPKGTRHYRSLPKLSMLPSSAQPKLVFLGVKDSGNEVVFLVDAGLKAVTGGEGTCTPSGDQCATLTMEPGERQTFTDDAGVQWTIQIDEVRETTVASATKSAKAAEKRERKAARASGAVPERFHLPILTDLFTTTS